MSPASTTPRTSFLNRNGREIMYLHNGDRWMLKIPEVVRSVVHKAVAEALAGCIAEPEMITENQWNIEFRAESARSNAVTYRAILQCDAPGLRMFWMVTTECLDSEAGLVPGAAAMYQLGSDNEWHHVFAVDHPQLLERAAMHTDEGMTYPTANPLDIPDDLPYLLNH